MSASCPDVLMDLFAYLDRNELERNELVSRIWKLVLKAGKKHLKQRRIFSSLVITRDVFYHHYRPNFPTYLALLENPLHEVERSGRIKCPMAQFKMTYTGFNKVSRSQILDNLDPSNPLIRVLRDEIFDQLYVDPYFNANFQQFCYIGIPVLSHLNMLWKEKRKIKVRKINNAKWSIARIARSIAIDLI